MGRKRRHDSPLFDLPVDHLAGAGPQLSGGVRPGSPILMAMVAAAEPKSSERWQPQKEDPKLQIIFSSGHKRSGLPTRATLLGNEAEIQHPMRTNNVDRPTSPSTRTYLMAFNRHRAERWIWMRGRST